jgi:hypothetical protein
MSFVVAGWGVRRIVATSLVLVVTVLASVGASASPRIWVRGPAAQAGMIGDIIGPGTHQIQILGRRCANVRDETGCTRISDRLRHAIEAEVAAPIRWVSRMWSHAGHYWVFAPFVWDGERARLRFAWNDVGVSGCSGGGKGIFELRDDAWRQKGSSGYFGCPAT